VTAARGAISVVVGTVLLRLALTGVYQRYLRVGMRPWLVITGIVVVALGIAAVLRPDDDESDDHEHDHHGSGRLGWLLLAPIAVLLLVAPPSLGSFAVDRANAVDIRAGKTTFDPLPTGEHDLTLLELSQRAVDHDGASLEGATVRLTGFVAATGRPFRLARYQIACCAADAAPIVVRIAGAHGDPPERDQWVTITGTYRPGSAEGDHFPIVDATSITEIPPPEDPYE